MPPMPPMKKMKTMKPMPPITHRRQECPGARSRAPGHRSRRRAAAPPVCPASREGVSGRAPFPRTMQGGRLVAAPPAWAIGLSINNYSTSIHNYSVTPVEEL